MPDTEYVAIVFAVSATPIFVLEFTATGMVNILG
jgi:hypothetical protein